MNSMNDLLLCEKWDDSVMYASSKVAWGSFELFQFFGHALKYSITFICCNSLQHTWVQKYILSYNYLCYKVCTTSKPLYRVYNYII